MPNTTVETLETPVSRADCGSTQLCADEPSDCDPSQAGSCFFISARQTSGRNFEFGLSGESTGYLCACLSLDVTAGGNATCYICANNNSNVQFFGANLNNDQLTQTTLNVNSVKGRVDGNKIQCTFAVTIPAQLTRAQSRSISVATGTFSATTGALGSPTTVIRTPVVNLADPNATITNIVTTITTTNTTASPSTAAPTTDHAVTLQQSLTHALLVTVGVLGLAML
ncbi:putative ferric-chelate reductase 1 [Thunnus albacares]|uniref:putative ferric-chelate reductase 1 n=1 Tax=Thunnus albacares TaxID=8236 RepID=UPI001CF6AB34|nr:putative ferric-chelate reductase 1 [Thunnus albacares]